MAIITKGAVEKGTSSTFTLDKAELAADALVAADAYFSDDANWAFVQLIYKSDVGGQSEVVVFDASQVTPTASFLVSATARDIFEVQRLVIVDHDGGRFIIPRADLTIAEFDIDMSAPAPSLTWTKNRPSDLADYGVESGLLVNTAYTGWDNGAKGTAISGDFVLTYKFEILGAGAGNSDVMLGYSTSNPDLSTGLTYLNASQVIYASGFTAPVNVISYGAAWVNSPNATGIFPLNTEITFAITRVGGLITYAITGGNESKSGTIQSSYTGDVYAVYAPYSLYTRLNSVSLA
jgi:hypothetical protein